MTLLHGLGITDRDSQPAHYCRCGAPAVWLSYYQKPTCHEHRPQYDAGTAAQMRLAGWSDTADSYRRWFDGGAYPDDEEAAA